MVSNEVADVEMDVGITPPQPPKEGGPIVPQDVSGRPEKYS